jgi:glycerol-3-phosphate acyltransferase PlsX
MKIVVDVMGSDKGPAEIIKGAVLCAQETGVKVLLAGDSGIIRKEIDSNYSALADKIEILHADEEITMNESPLTALRQKKKSSIAVGLDAVKQGIADGFVSPGNTGAVTACATLKLRLIKGIERAGITALFPNMKHSHSVVIDVGANVDAKPKHLLHYGVMASVFSNEILGIKNVRVGLLNVGEEEIKGNELSKAAFEQLKSNIPAFKGNVEGGDIYNGSVDVVVCDGFTGNVVLKSSEQLAKMFFQMVKEKVDEKLKYKIGALLMKQGFMELKRLTSASQYGGAQLLGVNGYCIICHGSSSYIAIKNAVRVAKEFSERKVTEKVIERIGRIE